MIPMLASSPWSPRGQHREPLFWAARIRKCALWVATSSPTDSRWSQYFLTMSSCRFNPHSIIKYSKIRCGGWNGIWTVSAVSFGIRTVTSTIEGSWIFKRFMLLILVNPSIKKWFQKYGGNQSCPSNVCAKVQEANQCFGRSLVSRCQGRNGQDSLSTFWFDRWLPVQEAGLVRGRTKMMLNHQNYGWLVWGIWFIYCFIEPMGYRWLQNWVQNARPRSWAGIVYEGIWICQERFQCILLGWCKMKYNSYIKPPRGQI